MIRNEKGFTLVELIITMTIFVLVIAAASGVFTGLLTQFKQQSKITETNIEGIVGLEILRHDLASAGFGIPWHAEIAWNTLNNYTESSANPYSLNDSPNDAPRGVVSENNADFSGVDNIFDGADYLAIKAINIANNEACTRWTTLKADPVAGDPDNPREWEPALHNLIDSDYVIVVQPGTNDTNAKTLVVDGTDFYTIYSDIINAPWPPLDDTETNLVYGIIEGGNGVSPPRRPFNRADYFITRQDESGNSFVPERCAPNTGVLVKALMNHDATGTFSYMPLLDCVADFQVVYGLDIDNDGDFEVGVGGDTYSDDISGLTEVQIRDQVKLVRAYVLGHEGQFDSTYTYPSTTVNVGGDVGMGRTVNLSTAIGTTWQNYRWKLYTIVLRPLNLE